jgi:hypothetical protein
LVNLIVALQLRVFYPWLHVFAQFPLQVVWINILKVGGFGQVFFK